MEEMRATVRLKTTIKVRAMGKLKTIFDVRAK